MIVLGLLFGLTATAACSRSSMRRASGALPLTPPQKETNRIKSSVRAKVEHPFAWTKNRYLYDKVCYKGLVKNSTHWFLICAVYNFKLLVRKYA